MGGPGGAVPHRDREQLRRKHLAHSDDPDGQGLCRRPDNRSQHRRADSRLDRTDAPAELGAIEDFINQGYDAIVTIAVSPDGFDRVIRLADRNDVVVVSFDNLLDTDQVMQVNEDQYLTGRTYAEHVLGELAAIGTTSGKVLEVRGLPGNSVDRDRSVGINDVLDASGGDWERVSVVGNWDDGTAQEVVADAIAVHGEFENGYRKFLAEYSDEGLTGISIGQSPGLVTIPMKAAWRMPARRSSFIRPTTQS